MKGEEKLVEVAAFLLLLWIVESKGRVVVEQETSKTCARFLKGVPCCVDDCPAPQGKLRLLLVDIVLSLSFFWKKYRILFN